MPHQPTNIDNETDNKPSTTVQGIVTKVIKSPDPGEPDKAEIVLPAAEPLYQEIRIDNKLTNEKGEEVSLKSGAPVEVIVQADSEHTETKRNE